MLQRPDLFSFFRPSKNTNLLSVQPRRHTTTRLNARSLQRAARLCALTALFAVLAASLFFPASSASSSGELLETLAPAETIATFASDCTTPKSNFILGETVCAQVTNAPVGSFPQRRFNWIDPTPSIRRVTDITSSTQTDLFTLPSTPTSTINGEVVDNRGNWMVNDVAASDQSVRARAIFSVSDPQTPTVDLSITKAGPMQVAAGGNISYRITLVNYGPSTAQSVQVTDVVPANTTFVSETQNSGATFNCTNPPAGGTGTTTCALASLPKDATASFTFVYKVGQTVPDDTIITNTASISSSTTELHPPDNSYTVEATVVPTTCVLSCPQNITVNNDADQCGAVVTYTSPSSTGSCGIVECSPASGELFPVGVTYVDCSGESGAPCNIKVTVNDTQAPVITCPANISTPEDASNPGGATVDYTLPDVQDNCPNATVTCSMPPGSRFPLGTTSVSCTATDASNNTASCSFNVRVFKPGTFIISELRLRGTNGVSDEYIEFYNNTNTPLTVSANDTSSGWSLVSSDNVVRFTIPNGTVIPARGHFLATNSTGYSLSAYPAGNNGSTATGNITYTGDITDARGIALFRTSTAANFTPANVIDAVGFGTPPAPFAEGTPIPTVITTNAEFCWLRLPNADGYPQDTNDNASDFILISTAGQVGATATALGAPGPENLSSPILRNGLVPSLVDSTAASTLAPNRVRQVCGDPGAPACPPNSNTSTNGYLSVRRKFTNQTGANVTRLRFRIVDITTLNNTDGLPPTVADLRAITSSDVTVSTGVGPALVRGTTLETPPAQPNGGGLNSSLSAGVVTVGTPLAPNAEINVQFLFGLKSVGRFRFFVSVEALP